MQTEVSKGGENKSPFLRCPPAYSALCCYGDLTEGLRGAKLQRPRTDTPIPKRVSEKQLEGHK